MISRLNQIVLAAGVALLFFVPEAVAARLDGTVQDSTGAVVEGAQIWVSQNGNVRTTTSDAKGKFTMDRIDVAMTEVVGLKDGLAMGGATALVAGDVAVVVQLQPTDIISLKVLDSQSKPVSGAQVRSMLVQRSFLVSLSDLAPHGFPAFRSTDDGILIIPHLPKDGFIQLVLEHPDFCNSSVNYLPVENEQRNIVLQRGQRIGGRITFKGQGVPDARVSVFRTGPQGQKNFAENVTDSEGFYSVRVEPDVYGVAVRHHDYASPTPVPVEVAPNQEAPAINLELKPAKYIRGKVVLPNKKACGGARITYREGPTIYDDTFSNNNGEFKLKVPGDPGAISIGAPAGYYYPSPVDIQVNLLDAMEVELKPIELERLPEITGTILDEDDKAAGPALVTALNLPVPFSVLSNEKGEFSMPLTFMPLVDKLVFHAEHKLRFQRAAFDVGLKKTKPAQVKLEPYTPDLAQRQPVAGANNLDGLLGKPAPPWTGDAWVNSDPVTMDSLKGKVIVLLFWAGFDEDMGPVVIRELITLKTLLADLEDVAFVGIHDAISSKDEIKQYIQDFGIDFPVLRDTDDQTTFGTYGIVRIPQIVLLDKKGALRYYQTEGRLLELIKALRRE